jgi:zinc and cadmium transporter
VRLASDSTLWWIILYGVVGSVGALAVASVVLFLPVSIRKRLMPYLLSYAAGALLATALGGILPEALALGSAQAISVQSVLFGVLGGLLLFFALEGLVIWRHEHGQDVGSPRDGSQRSPSPVLIIVGDACHNFVDGVAITTSFLASPALGLATTLAVVGHEIPQEVGDFVLLLHSGLSRRQAIIWNGLASFSTLLGALLAYAALDQVTWAVPYALAVAAASFLYIGLADLVPGLHGRHEAVSGMGRMGMMLGGVGTILLMPH